MLYQFSTTNSEIVNLTNKRRNITFNIRHEHETESITRRLLSKSWNIINDIRLFVFQYNKEYKFSRQIIKLYGKILNNYNTLFDSLNVGEYGCIDVIIKQVISKLIPKVSVIVEGITYVVKELKKRMCRLSK